MMQMAPLEGSSREAGEGWLRVRNRFIVGADACIRPRKAPLCKGSWLRVSAD